MDLTRRIDGYCERISDAFWAEPVNALTNVSFIVGALVALWIARREGRLDGPVTFLIGNAIVVGFGSFLFHTYATVWAAMADTGPILVFILAYFTIAMNRYAGMGWGMAALTTAGFLVAMVALSALFRVLLHDIVGGSQSYFPAMLALLGVGGWLASRGHPAGRWLIGAGALFAVSLTFRSLDRPLCDVWPTGTHFLWHLLNGLLLWMLTLALIRHGDRARTRGGLSLSHLAPPPPRVYVEAQFSRAEVSPMKARVFVTLKSGVLDPQGEAIRHALGTLGFDGVESVRQGKVIELELQETDAAKAEEELSRMAEKLLANTVIENYRVEIG